MTITLIRGLHNIRSEHQGSVVTIGNYDGLHIGHQQIIAKVIAEAKERGVKSTLITFEPQPKEFFAKEKSAIPARLTRFREKLKTVGRLGIDQMLCLPFNMTLAKMTAQSFVDELLVNKLAVSGIVVGDDFHFGTGRDGDFALLQQQDFAAWQFDEVESGSRRVSSTLIRELLAQDDLTQAAECLGRPYTMMGAVEPGAQLGRQWGIPTANVSVHRRVTPVHGIYTIKVHGLGDKVYNGVASIGTRPTVDDSTRTLLEVHLFEFDQDIYGKHIEVEFCHKLRPEERFDSIDELKQQIYRDVEEAKKYFYD